MELEIINPINYKGWDNILVSNENYSFFHSSIWAKVLFESYQYKPMYFTLIDRGKLLALISVMEIRSFLTGVRGVSLPFSDFCEPIISENIRLQNVLEFILQYGEKSGWDSLEIRGGQNFNQGIPFSEYYYIHTLSLTQNIKQIFSNFRSNTRRNIKKANREGIRINICNSLDSIDEFYQLNCKTRKYHGLPPQPFYFFKKVFEDIISKNNGFVILASFKGKVISGAIFFHIGKFALYKYAASNRKYQHLRANNLIIWEAIKMYSGKQYNALCFGRTEPENIGLIQFKDGWGTKKEKIYYYKYNLRQKRSFLNIGQTRDLNLFNTICNKIPIPFLKILGSMFYKHIG